MNQIEDEANTICSSIVLDVLDDALKQTFSDTSKLSKEILRKPAKKPRKFYNCQVKANIIMKLLDAQAEDKNLSAAVFAETENISKSMLSKWLKEKDMILTKAYEGCILKKFRPKIKSKHIQTFELLHKEFLKQRNIGHKISFLWMFITGRKIAKRISMPIFTRRQTQNFIAAYNIKMRRVQRKKQQPKTSYTEALKQWHLNLRESLIKSKSLSPHFDSKWGRFKPNR